jgi:hypothetical protein
MNLKLHLLESFEARAADGSTVKVRGYERMVEDPTITDGQEHWQSTGVVEYRLDDGAVVAVDKDGTMRVANTGRELKRA